MLNQDIKDRLKKIVGSERFQDDPETIVSYSYDGFVAEADADVVLFPLTTLEVSRIMKIAAAHRIPVTARGAGTNLSGGSIPAKGGIVLCFIKMNQIVEVNTRDRYAIVQPGVINGDLQKVLALKNFFYPPDPSSFAISTIGGNVAENAGGPRCLKYGVTADYILGMEVVLASGKVIQVGSCNVKDVTGYRLASLFCGSEGTLGIVTEITVRVRALPESFRTVLAIYDNLEATANTVADIIGSGIIPAAMELMDKVVINLVEDVYGLGLPRSAEGILLIEADGIEEAVEKQMNRIIEKVRANGAIDVKTADTETERENLWKARRSAHGVIARLAPNCITEDATVPVSNVPKMIRGVKEITQRHNIKVGILAHAGDGNMHPVISTDIRNKEEWARVEAATEEIFNLAASLNGTLSGEHGVGLAKTRFLPLFMDHDTREFMATIKKAVDPLGILNPGKFVS
ncbi:MAG: FAD-binding protein [Desulfobacula sp.]|nr:FAD-binding protein [Desulfobacula sp.]